MNRSKKIRNRGQYNRAELLQIFTKDQFILGFGRRTSVNPYAIKFSEIREVNCYETHITIEYGKSTKLIIDNPQKVIIKVITKRLLVLKAYGITVNNRG